MRILAIDTSTMMSSICILEDGKVKGDFSINQKETHSEMLVPLIKRLLDDLKLNLKDIDLLAVAHGPGSFTGLRIGMTSLKAIAQALDKPMVGISTLKAIAYNVLNGSRVVALLDARGTRYFAGFYHWHGQELVEDFEGLIEEDLLYEKVKDLGDLVFVGEGVEKLGKKILDLDNIRLAHSGLNYGIAKNIAVLSKIEYDKGRIQSHFDIQPNYLRRSQAEINFDKNKL